MTHPQANHRDDNVDVLGVWDISLPPTVMASLVGFKPFEFGIA